MSNSALRDLFDAANEATAAERVALLERADPELRSEVLSLLAAADRDNILDRPLLLKSAPRATLAEETVLGRYRIVREIGSGGMGTVYLAELADDGPSPSFALKVVRALTPELAQRLLDEARILSRLDHPHIARLLDAGTTPDGQPFLVMEYVNGTPIHRAPGSREDHVRWMRQVCSAVQYLHQHLVVHQDLKPANILVNEAGVAKVVDFGVAAVLSEDETFASGPLTPEYASPEQLQGGAISTVSDVFTVGLVLYELLAGARPFAGNALDVARQILIKEAPALPPSIPRDLDCIVHRALARDPQQRYASAADLDEDLRRFQERLPIAARGKARLYRLRMIALKHNVAVAASIIALIATAVGFAAVERESRIARQERQRAEQQTAAARQAQARAEESKSQALRDRTDALIQKADAERRLQQLQTLAAGATRAYQESERPGADRATILATLTRDTLLTLKQETPGSAPLGQQKQLDLVTAKLRSGELATPGDWKVPKAWSAEGGHRFYRIGLDSQTPYNKRDSLYLTSIKEGSDSFAKVYQLFSAKDFRGKRVRFSAMIRTEGTEYGLLGVRTYWQDGSSQDAYRLVRGTAPWTLQQVVFYAPSDAEMIEIAVLQSGPGTTWANAFDFRVVDRSVPLTDSVGDVKSPNNLDFSK